MKIGIRREDKNQWGGRAPLIPEHIKELSRKSGLRFYVQPSDIRAFSAEEFRQAGAEIREDLSVCPVICAVKEIPVDYFLPDRTYLFFSHTIKGQMNNMPMLKKMMELGDTLIDYEKIVDEKGKRLVFFGRFAGIAGMIDSFWTLGRRLDFEGSPTIFSEFKPALHHKSLPEIIGQYREIGKRIASRGISGVDVPLIFGFAGYGNVSRGAQEIFDLLPFEELRPEELADFYHKAVFSTKKLYKVVFKEEHLAKPKLPGAVFKLQDYYDNPQNYESRFEEYLPYLSVLINAIYWDKKYPRLVTRKYLSEAYQTGCGLPLKVIGDITCDMGGSIECNLECTDSGNPVYVYEPLTGKKIYGVEGHGPVILAVDNLPCELPRESSTMFSEVLKNFIARLASTDFSVGFEENRMPPELKNATVLYKGQLTPRYRYLEKYLAKPDL